MRRPGVEETLGRSWRDSWHGVAAAMAFALLPVWAQAQVVGTSVSNVSVVQSATQATAAVSGAGSSLSSAGSFQAVQSTAGANASADGSYAIGHADATASTLVSGRVHVSNVSVGGGSGSAGADSLSVVSASASSSYGSAGDPVGGTVDVAAGAKAALRAGTGTNGQALADAGYSAAGMGTSDATSVVGCPGTTSMATTGQPVMGGGANGSFDGTGAVPVSNAAGNALVMPTAWAVQQDDCGGSGGDN